METVKWVVKVKENGVITENKVAEFATYAEAFAYISTKNNEYYEMVDAMESQAGFEESSLPKQVDLVAVKTAVMLEQFCNQDLMHDLPIHRRISELRNLQLIAHNHDVPDTAQWFDEEIAYLQSTLRGVLA